MSSTAAVAILQERFERFIPSMPGYENVDELLKGVHLEGKKRADYLLCDRRVIVEQKVLIHDPSRKPQQFVTQLIRERGYLLYGTTSTNRIFAGMADGQEQKRRMFLDITKGVEANFAAADKQTRDTREIFAIPDAVGIVLFLNLSAPTLHPDLIRFGLSQTLQKKREDGSMRYRHTDGLVVISEAHIDRTNGSRGAPCYSSPTPHSQNEHLVREVSDLLIQSWAAFNGVPVRRQESFKV